MFGCYFRIPQTVLVNLHIQALCLVRSARRLAFQAGFDLPARPQMI